MTRDEFNNDYTQRDYNYQRRANPSESISEFHENYEPSDTDTVTLAGRISRLNDIGQIAFLNISNSDASIQLVFREDGTENFENIDTIYPGDYIEATGVPTETNTGEFSLDVDTWELLG